MTKTFKVELANKIGKGQSVGNLYGVGEYLVYGPGDERRRGWVLQPQPDQKLAHSICYKLIATELALTDAERL